MYKTFVIKTLGCRTNQYESQVYREQLNDIGCKEVQYDADLCIVNTCAVTESASRSSERTIKQLRYDNPNAMIAITGCAGEEQIDIENVLFCQNINKEHLISQLFPENKVVPFEIKKFDNKTRAFVKIQDGCNSFCSYCIIPYVRGRSRSRRACDILREIKRLVENGYKEIVLTGINIGDFDSLPQLIHEVDNIPGLHRLRLSSIDPNDVSDELCYVIINGKTTCPSFHLVLQSGADSILKSMRRKYTRKVFLDTVDRLRKLNEDFTFTTDIIIGFPGESDNDFRDTLEVMDEVKFAKVHLFPYSARSGTQAMQFDNIVPFKVVKERKEQLLNLAQKHAFDLQQKFVSRKMKVLLEKRDPRRPYEIPGRTHNFLKCWVQSRELKQNDLVEVELFKNTYDGLLAK